VFQKESFIELDIRKAFGINLLKPDTVSSYINKLNSYKNEYTRSILLTLGYPDAMVEVPKEKFALVETFLALYNRTEYLYAMNNYFY